MSRLLTVVCPALVKRIGTTDVLQSIERQAEAYPGSVEILVLMDSGHMTIGEKMNRLYRMSSGLYTAAVADDDRVSEDYVGTLVAAITGRPGADVYSFPIEFTWGPEVKSMVFGGQRELVRHFEQPAAVDLHPGPIHALRTSICREFDHPHVNKGEDLALRRFLIARDVSEVKLSRPLYFSHYRHFKPEFGNRTYAVAK